MTSCWRKQSPPKSCAPQRCRHAGVSKRPKVDRGGWETSLLPAMSQTIEVTVGCRVMTCTRLTPNGRGGRKERGSLYR